MENRHTTSINKWSSVGNGIMAGFIRGSLTGEWWPLYLTRPKKFSLPLTRQTYGH
jgi:hypothetical protein